MLKCAEKHKLFFSHNSFRQLELMLTRFSLLRVQNEVDVIAFLEIVDITPNDDDGDGVMESYIY